MTYQPASISNDPNTLPQLPGWITAGADKTLETVAFRSGAALGHLHLVLGRDGLPHALFRDRLALRAAEACVAFSGRVERAAELRDAIAFVQPGDFAGPAGEICLTWRRAVERPVSVKALHRALPEVGVDQIATWLDGCDPRGAGQGAPVSRAAMVLEAVLTAAPRAEVAALILAEAALAQALGWDYVLPVLATGLKRADLRKRGEDLGLACHRAVTGSVIEAVRLAADLERRAAHLRAIAPKLRAKGAAEAVEMFLTRDAIAPAALPLPDRAARRLCDRLVDLNAVRELTGRDTFRLYGV